MYQALRTALSQVDGLHNVELFNNQYEGTMKSEPSVFIEFDPLEIDPVVRMAGHTDIGIHLHVATKAYDEDNQNTVTDASVASHHSLAEDISDTVDGYYLPFEGGVTRPLELARWMPQYKYNGWIVTVIYLKTIG
jgi:hypothetical protein